MASLTSGSGLIRPGRANHERGDFSHAAPFKCIRLISVLSSPPLNYNAFGSFPCVQVSLALGVRIELTNHEGFTKRKANAQQCHSATGKRIYFRGTF